MMSNEEHASPPVSVAGQCGVDSAAVIKAMLLVVAATVGMPQAFAATSHPQASFERERPTAQARQMAEWIVDSGDSHGMPFVIVDKVAAKVFVFAANGHLGGASAVLLGQARGDDSVPDIGTRKLSSILPQERTTPAGRYEASLGRDMHNEVLWIDYDAAFSMHPVITSNASEHRAQRLASPTPLDNRISYGCINVPAKFYKNVVSPTFRRTSGIVYVMPETRALETAFPALGAKGQVPRTAPQPASN